MKKTRRDILALLVATPAVTAADRLFAQGADYPSRPLRIIVPVPPGGLADTLARSMSKTLQGVLGQPVVVENKPGASSIIGTDYVLKQPADGYTMLFTWTAIVQNPLLYPSATYDPVKDFTPVARLGSISALLAVGAHVEASNLKEFVAYAKSLGKPLSYGTTGTGSAANFYGEIMSRTLGIELVHVPYKGDADMLPDLLQQRVDAIFIQPASVDQHVKDGKVKIIAVTGPKRIRTMPAVATFEEQGLPGLDDDRWFGVFMRAGTPQPIVDRLSGEIAKWVALPDTQDRMHTAAMDSGASNSVEFTQAVAKSQQQWREIVRRVPIRLQ